MASTKKTHTFVTVRHVFFAVKATNFSVTADDHELQMTFFKCKSLRRKVIIVVTARHFLVFLTLYSQLKFSENLGKNRLDLRE